MKEPIIQDQQVEERSPDASPEERSPEDHLVEERSPKAFLFICREKLNRYNLESKKISPLLTFPFDIDVEHSVASVKVNDYLYLIIQHLAFLEELTFLFETEFCSSQYDI